MASPGQNTRPAGGRLPLAVNSNPHTARPSPARGSRAAETGQDRVCSPAPACRTDTFSVAVADLSIIPTSLIPRDHGGRAGVPGDVHKVVALVAMGLAGELDGNHAQGHVHGHDPLALAQPGCENARPHLRRPGEVLRRVAVILMTLRCGDAFGLIEERLRFLVSLFPPDA